MGRWSSCWSNRLDTSPGRSTTEENGCPATVEPPTAQSSNCPASLAEHPERAKTPRVPPSRQTGTRAISKNRNAHFRSRFETLRVGRTIVPGYCIGLAFGSQDWAPSEAVSGVDFALMVFAVPGPSASVTGHQPDSASRTAPRHWRPRRSRHGSHRPTGPDPAVETEPSAPHGKSGL